MEPLKYLLGLLLMVSDDFFHHFLRLASQKRLFQKIFYKAPCLLRNIRNARKSQRLYGQCFVFFCFGFIRNGSGSLHPGEAPPGVSQRLESVDATVTWFDAKRPLGTPKTWFLLKVISYFGALLRYLLGNSCFIFSRLLKQIQVGLQGSRSIAL